MVQQEMVECMQKMNNAKPVANQQLYNYVVRSMEAWKQTLIFKHIKVIQNTKLPKIICIRVGIGANIITKNQLNPTPKLVDMSNYSEF